MQLHPSGAVFWEAQDLLLIADLHLGKAAHFRKHGIAVSPKVGQFNLDKLATVIQYFDPGGVLFLGDLFHSHHNQTWEEVGRFLAQYSHLRWELVLGNHDILPPQQYNKFDIHLQYEPLHYPPFYLTHHPMTDVPSDGYNLAGHIHPGVFLNGAARQRLKLPCFLFGERAGLLPAFGAFTGLGVVTTKLGDRVFVIADNAVIPVSA